MTTIIHIDIFISQKVIYSLLFGITGLWAFTRLVQKKIDTSMSVNYVSDEGISVDDDSVVSSVSSKDYFTEDEDISVDDDSVVSRVSSKDYFTEVTNSKKRKADDTDLYEFRNKMEDCLQAIKNRNAAVIIELLGEYDEIEVSGTENADRHWVYSKLHNDVVANSYKLTDTSDKLLVMSLNCHT